MRTLYALLFICALVFAPIARADNSYQPYYYDQGNLMQPLVNPTLGQQTFTPPPTSHQPIAPTNTMDRVSALAPEPEIESGIADIRASDKAAWFSIGTTFLNYKEVLSPLTDGERGGMPSMDAGASWMSSKNWYFAGEGSLAFGDVRYLGALENAQTGKQTPYDDWTHETMITVDSKVGKGISLTDASMLIPYGEFGVHFWDRNIRGVAPAVEDYTDYRMLGGLMLQTAFTDSVIFSAYGAYGLTFGGKLNTDSTTLRLGPAGMADVGGKISYAVTHRVDLFTTLDFQHFRYVKSSQEPNYEIGYYVYEPSSFTNTTTAQIGIAYRFE